jgi:hypothetical protein
MLSVSNCCECLYYQRDFDLDDRWIRLCQNPSSPWTGEISGRFPNRCIGFTDKYQLN